MYKTSPKHHPNIAQCEKVVRSNEPDLSVVIIAITRNLYPNPLSLMCSPFGTAQSTYRSTASNDIAS